MDWDKLRIFYAAASAGSFTHAADSLNLSQSAVSRQVASLEYDFRVPLFHRHARGLILTEQGEMLFKTAKDMAQKLEATKTKLSDSKEKPAGELKVTTTMGLGTRWLTPRLNEFYEQFPEMQINLILTDEELDLSMRQADVAIRVRPPSQPDLIQRKLFSINFHAYASADYLKMYGTPKSPTDLEKHRLIVFGGRAPNYMQEVGWLNKAEVGFTGRNIVLSINNISALVRAVESGIGIAVLPDYLISEGSGLVRVMTDENMPLVETFFVYPEELKNVARVTAFRDFLVSKAQKWTG